MPLFIIFIFGAVVVGGGAAGGGGGAAVAFETPDTADAAGDEHLDARQRGANHRAGHRGGAEAAAGREAALAALSPEDCYSLDVTTATGSKTEKTDLRPPASASAPLPRLSRSHREDVPR